jgi:epoxyqueuosine reductase
MSDQSLTAELKSRAQQLGFTLSGACPAVEPAGIGRFGEWLAAGYAGEMRYLANRAAAYAHPRHVLDGARSLLVLGFPYRTVEPEVSQPTRGRVARYAWGTDYHEVLWQKLKQLEKLLLVRAPQATVRTVVDTAPLLEREFAQLAGLGWIGKNTLLLNKLEGSYFFLAALLTDLDLDYDAPHAADHCGTCRACLDACPTEAFVAPYVLDARRCISYLTIELKSPIPSDLRTGIDDWVFGCDVCQEVCPWNRRAPLSGEPALQPRSEAGRSEVGTSLDLIGLFALDEADFKRRFRDTPLWRPKRRGILRNAAIVLGNQRASEAIPALVRGLNDEEPLVRGACAWALGEFTHATARNGLGMRLSIELDDLVRQEIQNSLGRSERAAARPPG